MSRELGLSLLDIAPLHEKVRLGDDDLAVHGLSVDMLVRLFQRFPDVRGWMSGTGVRAENLLAVGPDVIAAVIAYATTTRKQQADAEQMGKAEELASSLPVEAQVEILEAVGRLTFRSGFAPFASKVAAIMEGVTAASRSGNQTGTTSPRTSKTSSPPATTMKESGT